MGILSSVKGALVSVWSGIRHFFKPRLTLKYPDQKLDLEGPGYQFDAKAGVGRPGFKGRHLLLEDKCTGCQLCAIACDGIAVAIDMQPLNLKAPHNKKDIWPAVDYGRCVPAGVFVVASRGILPIEQIRAGDEVLTHRGRFKRVTQVFRRPYAGKMYSFRILGNPEPLKVTEGHPILVRKPEGDVWLTPDRIGYRDYLVRPIIKDEQPMPTISYSFELYHPAGRGGYFTIETSILNFTPDLARLIGYYLSEGYADRHRVCFDLNKKEESTLAADITACMGEVFGRSEVAYKFDKRSDGLKLVVDSVRIATFFHQFGSMCDKKELPPWALTVPMDIQAQIVKAAYLGDGLYSNKQYQYKSAMHSNFVIRTTSKILASQYSYMLGRIGIVSSICTNAQKDRKLCYSVTVHSPHIESMAALTGVSAKNSPSFSHAYIKSTSDEILSPVRKVSVEEVSGVEVFNLEVEDDHTFVAANQIVHNCVFCGLCVDACPFDALVMTNEYELSAYDRASLKYTPEMLFVPPKPTGTYKVKIDPEKGTAKHG